MGGQSLRDSFLQGMPRALQHVRDAQKIFTWIDLCGGLKRGDAFANVLSTSLGLDGRS
jgi:hypothetical protein